MKLQFRKLAIPFSGLLLFSTLAFAGMNYSKKKDIVDTAVESGQFDTLVTAIKEAGLVETLKGEGPFTVFAPNDKAFEKIDSKDLKALLVDKNKLTAVLTYHVVPGKLKAKDVLKSKTLKTVQGNELKVMLKDGKPFINQSQIIKTDIMTKNGIIHVIDTVTMP